MTTQTAVFSGLPTGLTLTKKVFAVADPDAEVTGITGAVNERTNAKGQYVVAVTKEAVITGDHTIILFVGSTPIMIGKRTFAGTDAEVATVTPEVAELNTAQYDAIIAAAEGSALTGPYTRTVTVTDSDTSTAIQNAKVRLYRTGETGTETTNVSGVATFTVEAATWSYAITANGYTGVAGTIAVSANGNTPIALVAATVTPPTNPSLSAIEVLCLGVDFEAESDIDIDFRIAEIATGDQNKTYPGAKVTVSSDSNGIARWEAPQGFVVEYKRGNTHSWQRVTLDSDSSTNVTSVIGSP